jgi:hypothetical protein
MTGQSSRGSSGGAGSVPEDFCSTLSFESIVNSPNPSVVQKISVSDPLSVELIQSQGTEVVALLFGADILGGMARNGERLKQCIQAGYEFQGHVRSLNQGLVKVFIEPKD